MSPSSRSSATSTSLIERVRSLDPDAWYRFAQLYAPVVYGWIRRAGLQEADVEDVGQEVFRVVAARIGTFRRERPGDSFRGWLWGITRNKLKEQLRHRSPAAGHGGSDAALRLQEIADSLPADSEQFDRTDLRGSLVRRALDVVRGDFDDNTWQAFWRTTMLSAPSSTVAAELNMSANAVRQAKYRVLRRLRNELDQLL